jgi:DNA-binding FadR family transcriptional regulator
LVNDESRSGAVAAASYAEDPFDRGEAALTQLRAWLAQRALPASARLPPERELCDILGVSRGDLRKALAVLEGEGELWRHVGKGTFLGERPAAEFASVAAVAARTSPAEVMRARLVIEPELAREAALHATAGDLRQLKSSLSGARGSATWRQYETWDNRLHRGIAEAAHNPALLAVFDTLNAVRRTVVWGRLRDDAPRPPQNHHSFAEHDAIVTAIENRDRAAAASRMRLHLQSVEALLLAHAEAAE